MIFMLYFAGLPNFENGAETMRTSSRPTTFALILAGVTLALGLRFGGGCSHHSGPLRDPQDHDRIEERLNRTLKEGGGSSWLRLELVSSAYAAPDGGASASSDKSKEAVPRRRPRRRRSGGRGPPRRGASSFDHLGNRRQLRLPAIPRACSLSMPYLRNHSIMDACAGIDKKY